MRRTFGVVILVACKRDAPIGSDADAASIPPFAASVAVAPVASATPKTARPSLTTYGEAMKHGRESTLASRYDDAIEDFRAATGFGDTAQAEGELGYAQLLAGKLDDALESLDSALRLLPAPELEAQIEFNTGLVYEKKGDAERARAAFARANGKHPTAAARAKLAGKSMCPASVVKEPFVAGTQYTLTTSWRDVYAFAAAHGASLLATPHDWTIKPASDADAKKLLASDCAGAPPWSINLGHLMFSDGYVYAAPLAGGRIFVVDGGMNGGGCGAMGARPTATSSATLHGGIVETTSTVEWWTDATCKTGSARTQTLTAFYDPDGSRVVTISAAATLSGRTVTIAAPGCDPVIL